MITAQEHGRLRARLDIYNEWAEQYKQPNGWTVIPAEAKPPVKVNNDERSAIEVFEIHRDKPAALVVYVAKGFNTITTWTGEYLGTIGVVSSWRIWSAYGRRMYAVRCTIFGREYYGRTIGEGMSLTLRALKTSA